MQHRQSYHLLSSVLTQNSDNGIDLFAWSVRTAVHGMVGHDAYLQYAAQAQRLNISSAYLENKMTLLAGLDVNAVAELIQASAGREQFARRWNGYDRLAPLGVKTRIIDGTMARGRHWRNAAPETQLASMAMREQIMASCLHALQPVEARPVRRDIPRRLLKNLEMLNIDNPCLGDLCCYLFQEPWADLPTSAQNLACSDRTLQRTLHAMGLRFANLRMAIRLNIASDAIRVSDASLTGIAQAAGFFDAAHMDHSWKLATGISPSQYRQLLT